MSIEDEKKTRAEAVESLEFIQNYDTAELAREEDLGRAHNLSEIVPHAQRLVDLFKLIPVGSLDGVAKMQLDQLKKQADTCFRLFEEVLAFDPATQNPNNNKDALIRRVEAQYQQAFSAVLPMLGYSLYKMVDVDRLETDAQTALRQVKDDISNVKAELDTQKIEAKNLLDSIREVAAEKGVTQQAIYFKEAAETNLTEAGEWQKKIIWSSVILGVYAVASIFLHKIPILDPQDNFETVQLAVSKILIFSVLSFLLYLCSKNFLSQKHNAIVNHHRQNALLTYNALVEASGNNKQASDAVLIHAAACIYAPQSTGYASSGMDNSSAKSVIELMSKPLSSNE